MIPTVPALLFRAATTTIDNLGFSSESIVEKAGVPNWQYRIPHALVPGTHFYRLVGASATMLGADQFGYLVAQHTPVASLDEFGARVAQSLTVYDAIREFSVLYGEMSSIDRFYCVEASGGLWWLRKRIQLADRAARQQVEIGALHYMIQTVRLGTGSNWTPEKMLLEAQTHSAVNRISEFGDATIHDRQAVSGIFVPRSVLAGGIHPRRLSTLPSKENKLFAEAPSADFTDSLRQIVGSYLSLGHPSIEEIADVVGTSARSVQRRLKSNGLTFRLIVDQARFQSSQEHLRDPQATLVEIAHDLGYTDQANFTRAFRRWTGTTPTEYRKLHAR